MADPPHFVKYAQSVIRVRVFAGLRERAGWSEKELEGVERVADVWPALDLGEEPPGLLYAVNRSYAQRDQELADGDEVALIPPVSGGAFLLSEEPLSLDAAVREVADEHAGAIATFVGTTRIDSRGRTVQHLEYEAYPGMAEEVMERIAHELESKYELCDGRDPPPGRPGRDRRDERRHRRLGPAPAGRAGRVQGRDRHAQGDCSPLEEGGLRGRRGVDRPRVLGERDVP